MRHVTLLGDWGECPRLLKELIHSGVIVSLLPENCFPLPPADLLIARLASEEGLNKLSEGGSPWVAWCVSEEKSLEYKAYRKGALSVFPQDMPEETIYQAVQTNLDRVHVPSEKHLDNVIHRRYQRGDVILLELDTVLEIEQGIIAQTMVHQDGSMVLLGLWGPHQMIIPHPADTCFIQLVSQSDTSVYIQPWERAKNAPQFPTQLRNRLRQLEAWAAMQARLHLDQRVLGILSLLAEQFGVATPQGQMIDIRITHTQLASAVGATRTTITRTLGDLRKNGVLSMLDTADGERYCLTHWEPNQHDLWVDEFEKVEK